VPQHTKTNDVSQHTKTTCPLRYLLTWFSWPCISKYACNGTNLMQNLPSFYSITIPLHVSGLLFAHHQEVTMYPIPTRPADSQLKRTTRIVCCI
jgi:hypothetical protein